MSSMKAIRRSLSSCLELTRMWRSTDRASLEKKPSMRLSHDPEELEKLDEFATAVAFLDQGMDVTGEQIDTGHQGQGAVALILVIAHHGRAGAGQWRAIRRGRTDRLDAGFLVIRDQGKAATVLTSALLPFRPQYRHLPVDTKDLGHLELELGIALFQVVAHLVRLDFLLSQDLAQ